MLIRVCSFIADSRAPPTEPRKSPTLAKGDYKGMVLTGASTYCAWRAILVAECKSEKLWKDLDGSAMTPDQNPRDLPSTTTTTAGESSTSSTVDTAKLVLCVMHTLVLNGHAHAIRCSIAVHPPDPLHFHALLYVHTFIKRKIEA